MKQRRWLGISILAALAGIASPLIAQAQAQSGKTIRLVVPFPPGGATDITARVLAEPMSKVLNQPVVVENKGGAGGSIGMAEVAKSASDGLTYGVATLSTHGVNPAVYSKLPYDPLKDFAAVTELVKAPGVLVVNATLPVQNYKEFVDYLKANPGKLSHASPGNGTIGHMWGELFKASTGTQMQHIPYKGAGPALNDVLSGQVMVYFDQVAASMPHIKSGKLRPIAISWDKRLDTLPNVPTYAEIGLVSNNDPSWFGLVAPAGTSAADIRRVRDAAVKAMSDPAVRQRLETLGLFPSGSTPEQFAQQIQREIAKMKEVGKTAGIKMD